MQNDLLMNVLRRNDDTMKTFVGNIKSKIWTILSSNPAISISKVDRALDLLDLSV